MRRRTAAVVVTIAALALAVLVLAVAVLMLAVKQSYPPPVARPLVSPTSSSMPLATDTPVPVSTGTPVLPATGQPATKLPTAKAPPTGVPVGYIAPYPSAPLCPDVGPLHNNSMFHTLWDGVRGCHYDHEHGTNPFSQNVADMFPGFDLQALLGGVQIGGTNPSSPIENTTKHGGFKWNVQLAHPQGCAGFESAKNGVNGSVIEYHNFGNYAIEAGARIHSTVALIRQCNDSNPTDYGYMFVAQFQDYGQRIAPYQGVILPYPDQPTPAYDSPSGPYLSIDCYGHVAPCGKYASPAAYVKAGHAGSNWSSKPTGHGGASVQSSTLFRLLFRIADIYQVIDGDHLTYPLTFSYLCSSDGGVTYNPVGCRYNNSTTQVQEIAGEIPASWDNLPGFDTDPRPGRITAEGYVSKFGVLNPSCTAPGPNCFPIKLVNAFVGSWGSVLVLSSNKGTNIVPDEPSRNIYFCGEQVCAGGSPGALPSGWIGQQN